MFGLSSAEGDRFEMEVAEADSYAARVRVRIAPALRRRFTPPMSLVLRAHRHVQLHPLRSLYCRCTRLRMDGRRSGLQISQVRPPKADHRLRTWDQGELGWSGVRLETIGQTDAGNLLTVDFTPSGLEGLGPFLELRFEAAVDRVSVGEARQVFQVRDTELVPVG